MDDNENAELNYCYKCMRQLESGQMICPDCGYDNRVNHNPPDALPEGSLLAGQYLVGKLLGQGGYGITYLGFDLSLQKRVAVKEYYPRGVCMRVSGSNRVTGVSTLSHPEDYSRGLEEFRREAQILAQISSPNIVRVLNTFRENGTAGHLRRFGRKMMHSVFRNSDELSAVASHLGNISPKQRHRYNISDRRIRTVQQVDSPLECGKNFPGPGHS